MPTDRSAFPPGPWRSSAIAALAAVGLVSGLCAFQAIAQAQPPVAAPVAAPAAASSSAPATAHAASATRPATAKAPGASIAKQTARQSTRPLWSELTEAQRQALAPLAGKWDSVSEAQKRKWLVMSHNYPKMSGAEQATLHSRMTEWVALSPQQRTQARLNYGNTQQISPDDKKAKWEAYQALPAEEKKKLAAGASKPPPTAVAVKPVPAEKLAKVPQPKSVAKLPRIAAGVNQVDQNTLLPQPGAATTH
jgi:hypothetical protein